MAVNWAIVGEDGTSLVLLPEERVFYQQNGVRFELESGGGYPGNLGTFIGPSGHLYLSNQRVVFLNAPSSSSSGFRSMSIPIGNISDGVFKQPWFSANYYEATVFPVPNGGLRAPGRMKLVFKEGGGFDFLHNFERLRERIHESEGTQIIEHLDELPAYDGERGPDSVDLIMSSAPPPGEPRHPAPGPLPSPPPQSPLLVMPVPLPLNVSVPTLPSPAGSDRAPSAPPPVEGPPPSYEQATSPT